MAELSTAIRGCRIMIPYDPFNPFQMLAAFLVNHGIIENGALAAFLGIVAPIMVLITLLCVPLSILEAKEKS